jgi:hypothetical protein
MRPFRTLRADFYADNFEIALESDISSSAE